MAEQNTNTLVDMLRKKERERDATRREAEKKRRAMVRLLEKDIFPLMPRSLVGCYRLSYVTTIFGDGASAGLQFEPTVDMHNDATAKRAIGTIDKVVSGLKRGGWIITKLPEARAVEWQEGMQIDLAARRAEGREAGFLTMAFIGINSTEQCRLVEKEVIIAAVPEHTETKMVVVCDEAPAP